MYCLALLSDQGGHPPVLSHQLRVLKPAALKLQSPGQPPSKNPPPAPARTTPHCFKTWLSPALQQLVRSAKYCTSCYQVTSYVAAHAVHDNVIVQLCPHPLLLCNGVCASALFVDNTASQAAVSLSSNCTHTYPPTAQNMPAARGCLDVPPPDLPILGSQGSPLAAVCKPAHQAPTALPGGQVVQAVKTGALPGALSAEAPSEGGEDWCPPRCTLSGGPQ